MVVEVANPSNSPMHYGDKPAVTTLTAPDALPNRVLYTNVEANRIYNELQYDIYQTQKRHDSLIKKPKGKTWLKIAAAVALVTLAVVFRKNIANLAGKAYRKVKNIFHRP